MRSVLEDVPLGSLHEDLLRGSTVEVVEPRDPWELLEASRDIILAASTVQRTVPVGFKQHFEDVLESAASGGLDAELILDSAIDTRGESTNRDEIEQVSQHPGITVLSTDLSDPFALWVVEGTSETKAGITVYSEGGIRGMIHNDNDAAIEWVRERYREQRGTATTAAVET